MSNKTLSRRQVGAITALLGCRTLASAASAAHVGESSLRRWISSDEVFQEAYRQAQHEVVEQAMTLARQPRGGIASF